MSLDREWKNQFTSSSRWLPSSERQKAFHWEGLLSLSCFCSRRFRAPNGQLAYREMISLLSLRQAGHLFDFPPYCQHRAVRRYWLFGLFIPTSTHP